MSDPYLKPEIVEQLREVQRGVHQSAADMSSEAFFRGTAEAWSACDYLKHLLLSVKPFAKAMTYPPDALKRRFGESSRASTRYAELVARYEARLSEGIRAEDYDLIMPANFRMPDGVEDLRAYLIDLWDEAHDRMIEGMDHWSEADMDSVQILHPALGTITVREMLFFTIFHNRLHWNDIRVAGAVI